MILRYCAFHIEYFAAYYNLTKYIKIYYYHEFFIDRGVWMLDLVQRK